jgi:hypothetical protein
MTSFSSLADKAKHAKYYSSFVTKVMLKTRQMDFISTPGQKISNGYFS